MLRTFTARAAAGLMVLVACPAVAEDDEAWRYQCLGDEIVGGKICTTELAVFESGEEFILYFVHSDKGAPPLVVSGESEGIAAVQIAVDKNDPIFSESCEDGACFFAAEDSAALMIQFRKGFRAKVTIEDETRQVLFDRVLSLRGFTAALTAPP